jgi:hypothetical protein
MAVQIGYRHAMSTLMMIALNAGMSFVLLGLGAGCAWVANGLTPPRQGGSRRWRGPSIAVSKVLIPIQG